MTTLERLPLGGRGRVQRVDGAPELQRRLAELGVLPGTRVELVRVAPLGDPLEVRVRGTLLTLRRREAACVEVEPEEQA